MRIADRQLAHTRRRGVVDDGARRRLGMAAIGSGPGFGDALEEELVAAARFQATRRRRWRLPLPRVGSRAAAAVAIVAVVAFAGVAAVRVTGGNDGDEIPGRRGPPGPPNATFKLVAMQRLTNCREPVAESLARSEEFHDLALLGRQRQATDALPFPPHRLPIGAFDPGATRRAAPSRPEVPIRVVPSTHVRRVRPLRHATTTRACASSPASAASAASRSPMCTPAARSRAWSTGRWSAWCPTGSSA